MDSLYEDDHMGYSIYISVPRGCLYIPVVEAAEGASEQELPYFQVRETAWGSTNNY